MLEILGKFLLRECGQKIDRASYKNYFKIIDYYTNHRGKKLLLYYEDMLNHKEAFINELYDFLAPNNLEKKEYVRKNIDKLFMLSAGGKGRDWGGINSNYQTDFYYSKIPRIIKNEFDGYLNRKLSNYPFIKKNTAYEVVYTNIFCVRSRNSDTSASLTFNGGMSRSVDG